ncbi:hypothetical protein BDV25DRAFT_4827 [Aspergillus avenaceus]|uniref:Ribosomal protein S21 n=1 Tax=Aspergillus avenaceus TaxID=36643 RepID=A0A5N6TS98_ASPAV|nr:hypothetical protein BDV25DRAFT_4827 [Aspergillus avenaceus]
MEMRTLTHALRSRPTSILSKQSLTTQIIRPSIRQYASKSPETPAPAQTQTPAQGSKQAPSDFDEIFSKLNLNTAESSSRNRDAKDDPLALSRAVKMSAETDNYRNQSRRVNLKLGPSLGRQVHVEPEKGTDVSSALRQLHSACMQNRVKTQSLNQKFHVRRGQVKKNLRIARWRKLFKFSFQKTVGRIQKMRAQGW